MKISVYISHNSSMCRHRSCPAFYLWVPGITSRPRFRLSWLRFLWF